MRHYVVAAAVVLLVLTCCQAEIFTALATMKRVLYIEKEIAEHLRSYVIAIPDRKLSAKVTKLANEYEERADKALLQPENYLANPVNAYLLCKRFTRDIKSVKMMLVSPPIQIAFEKELAKHEGHLPDEEDFGGVIDALLRLQDTYEIPPIKFVDGSFLRSGDSPVMTASDCFEIGRYSYYKGDHYHALMWFMQALSTHELEGGSDLNKIFLLDYLIYTADNQGNTRHAFSFAHQLLELEPENSRIVARVEAVIEWLRIQIAKDNESLEDMGLSVLSLDELPPLQYKRTLRWVTSQHYKNYRALCRGEDVMVNPYEHTLTCYYSTMGNNPLLILAPAKIEEKYHDPEVLIYHDVISDAEIDIVKSLSTPLLKRAEVNDPDTGKVITAPYRVSRSSWLYDNFHPTIETITKRVGAMTNLNMETAEGLQVVNYGIGGQYEPHFDHSEDENSGFPEALGNRLATWIYYLSELPAGGYTVFTDIGVRIPPTKGTAAFWWNLHKDGTGNGATRHAGCPVLSGSKWIANKWMHIKGQERHRPCGLTADKV